jgi:hypothetical protein
MSTGNKRQSPDLPPAGSIIGPTAPNTLSMGPGVIRTADIMFPGKHLVAL